VFTGAHTFQRHFLHLTVYSFVIRYKIHRRGALQTSCPANNMKGNPVWDYNSRSGCQQIQTFLKSPRVHYRLHKAANDLYALSDSLSIILRPFSSHSVLIISSYLGPVFLSRLSSQPFKPKSPHILYIHSTSYPPLFDHPDNIWRGTILLITKFLITSFTSVICFFATQRYKYPPQQPVLKHHEFLFSPLMSETGFHNHAEQQVKL
jgi:hypothetical protein